MKPKFGPEAYFFNFYSFFFKLNTFLSRAVSLTKRGADPKETRELVIAIKQRLHGGMLHSTMDSILALHPAARVRSSAFPRIFLSEN